MPYPISKSISTEQKEILQEAASRGLRSFYSPEPLRLSEWAEQYFYLSPEANSIPGAWQTVPYQRAIMNAISNDDIRVITWQKSARTGYSKIILAAIAYFAEHKKRGQVIYHPTRSDAEDFSNEEVKPMLRDVPEVGNLLKAGHPDRKSADNTVNKKAFHGSTLHILGGKSPRNFRRLTKDVVFYDELDGFDRDIGGEGSPLQLGDTRITTSSFGKSIRGSTPRIAGLSLVETSLSEAAIVFRYHVPCPDCGHKASLKWSSITWSDSNPATARHACEACGALAAYSELGDMLEDGVWISDQGDWIDDEDLLRDADGNLQDWPSHIGFFLWAAYAPWMSWPDLVEEFLKAQTAKKKGDLTKLKTFVNTRLGETWQEEGESPEHEAIMRRAEVYGPIIPMDAVALTAGVDLQADRIEALLAAWGRDEEEWIMERRIFRGDPAKKAIWTELAAYLAQTWLHESGFRLRLAGAAIDTGGHHTDMAYKFCRPRYNAHVYAIKGGSVPGLPIAPSRPSKKNKGKVHLFTLGTDTAKEAIYGRLKVDEPGPGYIHFHQGLEEDVYVQLTSEQIVTRYRKGFAYRTWEKKPAVRNEVLDMAVYALAALHIRGLDLNRLADELAYRLAERDNQPRPGATPPPTGRRQLSRGIAA